MITLQIYGGLGNQMFQYAAGEALALRTKQQLRLDTSWFQRDHRNMTPRKYELSLFHNITEPCGKFTRFYHHNRFQTTYHLLSALGFDYEKYILNICHEEERDLTEFFCQEKTSWKDLHINGYWQSEKYFSDFASDIKKAFEFPALTENKDLELNDQIKNCNTVSLHVRRTDYITNEEARKIFGETVGIDYYKKAVELMQLKLSNLKFAVFSDDIRWCREVFSLPDDTIFVDWHNGEHSFRDMQFMSLCSHHIIANSSFSWWGAWLGKNPEKIVIAPKKWMNTKDPLNDLRCPESWIRL